MDDIDRPERRGARRRKSQHISRRTLAALAVTSCFSASTALANPTGAQVVNGQVSIIQNGALLQITNTPNAIINWQSFSIGASEITKFIQQSQASAVLNRVSGSAGAIDPSLILGALQSNGRVFLINPSGIVFGAGAQIDVAGLLASSLNLSDTDFLSGRLRFTETPGAGSVVNQGAITTPSGGNVYLVGPAVTNSGIITSPRGDVVLAAGNKVELVDPASPNLRVEIDAPENAAVNLGRITAEAGRVGIYAGLVSQKGAINADSAVIGENGNVVLRATKNTTLDAGSVTTANGTTGGSITVQSGDTTLVSGTVEAKGSAGTGGDIRILGNLVGLTGNASINASGDTGGGSVLVGGDFHGANPDVQNAFRTFVGPDATIKADAGTSGDGGKVVVWSDDATRAYGTITARGGAQSGNGGFVETSGKQYLDFHSKVDVSAPAGMGGTLLLDPATITIVGGTGDGAASPDGTTTFQGNSTAGTVNFSDLDLTTAGVSNIYQSELEGLPGGTNIVLEATDYISTTGSFSNLVTLPTNSNLTMRTRNASTDGTGTIGINLTTSADGANLEFKTQGTGGIILQTGVGASPQSADITLGKLTTAGGAITINGTGNVSLGGISIGATGNLDVQSSGSITEGGSGAVVVTGTSRFVSTGSGNNGRVNLNLAGNSFGGQVTLAGTDLQIGSSSGNIDLAPISNAERLFAGANGGEVRLSGAYSVVDNGNFSPDIDFAGSLIRLMGDTSLTAKGSIQFNAQVLGPHQLTLDNTGPRQDSIFALTLGDTIGSGNELTGLTVRSDNAVSLASTNVGGNLDVQSSGSITEGGSGAVVVTGTSRFVSTGSGNNGRVNLNLAGNSFGGQVTLAGTDLQIGSSSGNIDLAPISNAERLFAGANGGEVRLSGAYSVVDNGNFSPDIDFAGSLIRLMGDTSLTAKGSIQFNAQVLGPHQLTLDNTGPRQDSIFALTLGDTIGSGNELTGLTVRSDNAVSLASTNVGGNLDVQSSGSITEGGSGAVVVTGTSRFVSTGSGNNGRVNLNLAGNSFGGQVTLAGTDLQIGSSSGNIDLAPISNAERLFAGANGGEVRLSGAYSVVDNGNFSPDIDFAGSLIRLMGDTSLTAKGSIQFNAQVLGPHQLTLDNTGPRQDSIFALTLGDTIGSGNELTGLTVRSDNAVQLSTVNATNAVDVVTNSGNVTLTGVVTAAGTGDTLVIAAPAGNLINNVGAGALAAPNGRWLVYSTSPAGSTENGLTVAAGSAIPRLYNRTYAGNGPGTIAAPGNHLIYSAQPTLAVTADPASRAYGSANPAFTYTTGAGLVTDDGFTDTPVMAGLGGALATTAVPASPVAGGPYAITQGTITSSSGYALSYTGANLTVTPVPLTIAADGKIKLQGDPNPPFTATATGYVLGESVTSLSGTLAFATPASSASPVGNYAITPSGVTSTNYAITFVDGILQIVTMLPQPQPAEIGPVPDNSALLAAIDRSGRFDEWMRDRDVLERRLQDEARERNSCR